MNEPRLPEPFDRLRVPAPPAELRARIVGAGAMPQRPTMPLWPVLWAASIAGLVAINLWLDGGHHRHGPDHLDALPSLAELRRHSPDDLLNLF